MSWLLATRIARPIEELSETADALAAGHLDARATPPVANDELTDLTGAFKAMDQVPSDPPLTILALIRHS